MRRTVLIVQKDFFARRKLKKLMEASGRFVTACTGDRSRCLELFRIHKPSLIFLDPAPAPDEQGIELLKTLHKEDGTVQVVMLGKKDGENMVDQYLLAGAGDFFSGTSLKKEFQGDILDSVKWLEAVPRTSLRWTAGNRNRVLVQQSSLSIRAAINYLLQESGYQVMGLVSECMQAVYSYSKTVFKPDIVIADDLETLKEFQHIDPAIPVMMCSSRSNGSFVAECVKEGAQDFLVIPFDNNELLKRVGGLCRMVEEREAPAAADPETE